MVKTFLRTTLVWVFLAFIGDTFLAPLIAIGKVAPDFSVIALVILALGEGSLAGSLGGFLLGLVQDLATPHVLGLRALCKTCLGFTVGRLRGRLLYGMPIAEGIVVALAVFAHDTVFLLVQSQLSNEAFLGPLFTEALPIALYSGLVGIPALRLADLLGVFRSED